MSLTSKLLSMPRRLVLGASLAAIAAGCGGTTEPKETGSLSVTASATPSSLLEGDSLYAGALGSAREGATLSGVSVFAAGQQANGSSSATLTVVPTTSGSVNATASGTRSQGAAASASAVAVPYTVTPLVAAGTPSANTGVAGQSITFPYTAPIGTDSAGVVASDGRRFVTAGNTGSATIPLLTAGNLTLTPVAYNNAITRSGTAANVNVTAAPVALRIITQGLSGALGGRVNVVVGAETINVPGDTTISRNIGMYQIGINGTQTNAYDYGQMDMNGAWRPLAGNQLKHNLVLDGNKTVTLSLLPKSALVGADSTEFYTIWRAPDGTLRPTKIVNWEYYDVTSGVTPGASNGFCQPMTQAQTDISPAVIARASQEDSAGSGPRRNITYKGGDPVADGKIILGSDGLWRPAPGVILRCSGSSPSNITKYDANGFIDGYWFRAGSTTVDGAMSEFKNFVDMAYSEGTLDGPSRISRGNGGIIRKPLDDLIYGSGPSTIRSSVMYIAWKAGQEGFGLLKAPQ